MTEKRPIAPDDLLHLIGLEDPRISPDGRWVAVVRVQADKAKNTYLRTVWLARTDGTGAFALTRSGKDSTPRWSPDGRFLAFVSGRADKPQIHLFDLTHPAGDPRKLTDAPNGVTGFAWSPDGSRIAYLAAMSAADRAHEADPETHKKPTEDDEKKKADPRVIRGMPYRVGTSYLTDKFSQVYVLRVVDEGGEAETPRRLTDVDANHGEPVWTPDGAALLTTRVDVVGHDEPGRHASVYRLDLTSGEMARLTDDSHADDRPVLSADGRLMAWMRFPREQMALKYSRLAVRDLVTGETVNVSLSIDVNPVSAVWARNTLYFNAQVHGRTWVYGVPALHQPAQPVVTFDGRADRFDVAADGTLAYVGFNAESLAELYVVTPDGQTRQLTQMNRALREQTRIPTWHRLTWEREGVEIEGWYALPTQTDGEGKPPLLLDIHGGPHIMWSPHYENEWHNWQAVLGAGYAVFMCNPRGSTGYGEAFQTAIHQQWGERARGDIMAGLEQFLALGLADAARMGVMGGSYGGYMTAWIVGRDHRFKAALAERGVYNLMSFTGTTDIPTFIADEFGLELFDDPRTLWQHSPMAYADQIVTPLLIIHSENDFRVAVSEAEQLFAAVRRAGHAPVEFVRYPREGHELSRAGEPEHRIDRLKRIIAWFDRWLKA